MSIAYDEKRKTYTVKISYIDDMGKRRQTSKRGFKLKREAKEFEEEYLRKVRGSSNMTFASLAEIYIKDCEKRLRQTTVFSKKYILDTKLVPYFGKQSILEIDTKSVRRWQNWLLDQTDKNGKPYEMTYIKTIHAHLSTLLNYAVKYYNLPYNPAKRAGTIGNTKAKSIQFWTYDEFNAFYNAVKDNPVSKFAFPLLFYTGMRIGEMMALTAEDFDLEAKTISINKTYRKQDGIEIVNPPKTKKSNRTIKVNDWIIDLYLEYIDKLPGYEPTQRLFTISTYYFHREIKRGTEISNVKRIRIHDLRHSHASLLIELGLPPLVISERLGHENIQTTLSIYSHLYPSKEEEVINKIQEVIERSH